LTFPHFHPTFRALRHAISHFPHPLRHSAIPAFIIHLSRPFPQFPIPSSTFLDFIPSWLGFFNLPINQISVISFSTITDSPQAPSIHSSMLFNIPRTPSAF
jgi:hypothetical protein